MKKQVLIVESRETFRKGLCAIFTEEPDGAQVYEAATKQEFAHLLESKSFDLIVIHQSLLTDITALPQGNIVILATQPDLRILSLARRHGARAYLHENASGALLRQTLYLLPGTFLNDQTIASWVSEYLERHIVFAIDHEILTSREREIFQLLCRGFSNQNTARQLGISESTLKTHVKHIYEKLHLNRRQIHILSQINDEPLT